MTARQRALKRYCQGPPEYGLNIPAGEYSDTGVRLLRTTDIGARGELAPGEGVFVPQGHILEPRHQLLPGDLLFSRAGSLGRCLRVEEQHGSATFAGYLVRFRPGPAADARFLEYCAQSKPFQAAIESDAITSTISNFNAERYASIKLPDLPLAEQRAIADYLDAETTRIDALIAKKQQLIQLLKERRSAVLERRLHDEVAEFPAVPVRHVAAIGGGITLGGNRVPGEQVRRPYLRVANVQDGYLDLHEIAEIDVTPAQASRFELQHGDVLLLEGNGNPDNLGRGTIWRGEIPGCLHQNHIHAVRPVRTRLLPEFFDLAVRSPFARSQLTGGAGQVSIATLSKSDIAALRLPLPPVSRQQMIVDDVRRELGTVDELGRVARRQLELLAEHRQALITAAVTGVLGVPGAA